MGFLTRDEMVTRSKVLTGGTYRDDSFIEESLRLGLDDFSMRYEFPQNVVHDLTTNDTVASQTSNSLPTGVWKLHDVSLDDGSTAWTVDIFPKKTLLDFAPGNELGTAGKPQQAYIIASTIYWVPVPDAAYNIRWTYTKLPGNAYITNAVSPIEGSDTALVAYASWKLLVRLDKLPQAEYWRQEYEREVKGLVKTWSHQPARILQVRGQRSQSAIFPSNYWRRWYGGLRA